MSEGTLDFDIIGNTSDCNSHTVVTGIANDNMISQCSTCMFTIAKSIPYMDDKRISMFRLFLLYKFMNKNCDNSEINNNFPPVIQESREKVTMGWSE
jgi:hypothetical protein